MEISECKGLMTRFVTPQLSREQLQHPKKLATVDQTGLFLRHHGPKKDKKKG